MSESSEELRAAARLVINADVDDIIVYLDDETGDYAAAKYGEAVTKIARHILAAHPFDGGEPWDMDWLREQGADRHGRFHLEYGPYCRFFLRFYNNCDTPPDIMHEFVTEGREWDEKSLDLAACPTKSDVLDLLRRVGFKKPEVTA